MCLCAFPGQCNNFNDIKLLLLLFPLAGLQHTISVKQCASEHFICCRGLTLDCRAESRIHFFRFAEQDVDDQKINKSINNRLKY